MQLFPPTFLSKTANAAEKKKGKKITINITQPNIPYQHPPTQHHHHHHLHLTTTTTTPPTYLPTSPHHLPHTHTTCTHTSYQAPTQTHPALTHSTTSCSHGHKYSSTYNQAISMALRGCSSYFPCMPKQLVDKSPSGFCYTRVYGNRSKV